MANVTGLLRSLREQLESSLKTVRQFLGRANRVRELENEAELLNALGALDEEARGWSERIGQLTFEGGNRENVVKQAQAPRRSGRRGGGGSGSGSSGRGGDDGVVPATAEPVLVEEEGTRIRTRAQRKKRDASLPTEEEGEEDVDLESNDEDNDKGRKKRVRKQPRDKEEEEEEEDEEDRKRHGKGSQKRREKEGVPSAVIRDGMPGRTRDGVLVYFALLDELPVSSQQEDESANGRCGRRQGNNKQKKQKVWTCPARTDDEQTGALVVERGDLQQLSLDCLVDGERMWYLSQVELDIVRRFKVNFPILFANAGKDMLSLRQVLIGDSEVVRLNGEMGGGGGGGDGGGDNGEMVVAGHFSGFPSVATTNAVVEALQDRMRLFNLAQRTSPLLSAINNIVLMVAASIHARLSASGAPDWHDAYLAELKKLSPLCSLTVSTIQRYRSVGALMLRSRVIACMLPSFVAQLEEPISMLLNDEPAFERLEAFCFATFPDLIGSGSGRVLELCPPNGRGGADGVVDHTQQEQEQQVRLLNAPPPALQTFHLDMLQPTTGEVAPERREQGEEEEENADQDEVRSLEDGFQVYKGAYSIDAFTRSAFESLPVELFHVIFNNAAANSEENDGKRLQVDLSTIETSSTTFHQFMLGLKARLREMVPSFRVGGASVLRSEAGCQAQLPHLDYPPTPLDDDDVSADVPLGCLVALMDGTRITVWPGAIGHHLRGSCLRIQPRTLVLNAGDVLLFRGDLVHAGASSEEVNVRVHCYLEPADGSFQRQLEPDGTEVTHFMQDCDAIIRGEQG